MKIYNSNLIYLFNGTNIYFGFILSNLVYFSKQIPFICPVRRDLNVSFIYNSILYAYLFKLIFVFTNLAVRGNLAIAIAVDFVRFFANF